MLQALLAVLMVAGGVLVSPMAAAQSDLSGLKKGIVKVSAKFAGTQKVGTGFIVGQGKKHLFVVTASHVVEGDTEIPKSIHVTFFTRQEEPFTAEVINKEGGDPRGLALLKVGGDFPDDVEILEWDTHTRFQGGEEVHMIGFPQIGGNAWAVTKGTLSGFDGPILKFSGAVEEGNSGGPLLYQGKVIGVIVEIIRQFGNAKPSQIAQFTVENWPGLSRPVYVEPDSTVLPEKSAEATGPLDTRLASLVITTAPKDAEVFVDDELVGRTTNGRVLVRSLDPDEYEIVVKKPGFRPWITRVDLSPGERRELTAALQKGAVLDVTGVWKNPNDPSLSYVLQQMGERVLMKEVTSSVFGSMVTAEGEGQLQGNHLEVFYRTALGTMGQSTATVSDDGQQLRGTFKDFSNMVPIALSLVRTADAPASLALPGNEAWKSIQEFGR